MNKKDISLIKQGDWRNNIIPIVKILCFLIGFILLIGFFNRNPTLFEKLVESIVIDKGNRFYDNR